MTGWPLSEAELEHAVKIGALNRYKVELEDQGTPYVWSCLAADPRQAERIARAGLAGREPHFDPKRARLVIVVEGWRRG